jgi:hypothetical protein
MEWVAVSGLIMSTDTPSITAILLLTDVPSIKVKASGSGVHIDGSTVSATVVTEGNYVGAGPFTANYPATSTKSKAEGSLVLRENDESETITATVTNTVSPFDSKDITFKAVISSAGQTKVRSN